MVSQDKRVVAAAVEKFLLGESEFSEYTSEQVESLQVALQCIQHVFDLESNPVSNAPDLMALIKGQTGKPATLSKEDMERAEQLKTLGNEHLTANRCEEAIMAYSEAIAIDCNNAIYYSNRAAAYMKVSDNEAAVKDCKEAIRLDPNFSKAYRRLGAVYTAMKNTDMAIEAYKKCLQIDPADASAKSSLEALLKSPSSASPRPASAGPRGSPFGAGGMPDLGSMLNNPELMRMAQQMMNSGALNNMMKDPNMMNMMQSMMGGMGGNTSGAAAEIEEEE